jgi:hypothetical protein
LAKRALSDIFLSFPWRPVKTWFRFLAFFVRFSRFFFLKEISQNAPQRKEGSTARNEKVAA